MATTIEMQPEAVTLAVTRAIDDIDTRRFALVKQHDKEKDKMARLRVYRHRKSCVRKLLREPVMSREAALRELSVSCEYHLDFCLTQQSLLKRKRKLLDLRKASKLAAERITIDTDALKLFHKYLELS